MDAATPRESSRLLVITTTSRTYEAFLIPYAAYFQQRGWLVDAAAAGFGDDTQGREFLNRTFDLPWTRRPADLVGALRGLRRIRKLLAAGRYSVVHVHTPVAG